MSGEVEPGRVDPVVVRQNGHSVRALRMARGMSGAQFARRLGVHPGTLHNIESERRSASEGLLARIAEGLGVEVEALERARPAD